MKCPFCKQHSASVIVLQPEGSDVLELALCEFCAQRQNLFEGPCLSLQALASRLERGEEAPSVAAPADDNKSVKPSGVVKGEPPDHPKPLVVGPTLADKLKGFQKTGRLSGAEDYDTLETQLTMLFRKIQGGARHKGKVPRVLQAVRDAKDRLSELEQRLAAAVAAESYEKAAELRDEIKRLKAVGDRNPMDSAETDVGDSPAES